MKISPDSINISEKKTWNSWHQILLVYCIRMAQMSTSYSVTQPICSPPNRSRCWKILFLIFACEEAVCSVVGNETVSFDIPCSAKRRRGAFDRAKCILLVLHMAVNVVTFQRECCEFEFTRHWSLLHSGILSMTAALFLKNMYFLLLNGNSKLKRVFFKFTLN